jgi:hypothetical protein
MNWYLAKIFCRFPIVPVKSARQAAAAKDCRGKKFVLSKKCENAK